LNRKIVIAFVLLVLAPAAALCWFAVESTGQQRQRFQHEYTERLQRRLDELVSLMDRRVEKHEQDLQQRLSFDRTSADELRDLVRTEPLISAVFLLDANGALAFPPSAGPRSKSEDAFLDRTKSIWQEKSPLALVHDESEHNARPSSGWRAWYWNRGIHLLFHRRSMDGRVLGAEVDSAALLADLVAELPTSDASGSIPGRFELVDSDGSVLHLWGGLAPQPGQPPRVLRSLAAPLGAWKLAYVAVPNEEEHVLGRAPVAATVFGVSGLVIALFGLGFYVLREHLRTWRTAQQRMTFVNQVSHELKTPLTNIRMYAELLEERSDDLDPDRAKYIRVIVSESQRLGRLIGNVLSLARKQRGKLRLHCTTEKVDDAIRQVVDQHRPSLEQHGLQVELDLNAPGSAKLDADALGQILSNLLSNVEKYAPNSGRVIVRSRRSDHRLEVRVIDSGPGIPPHASEDIFAPFYRLSSKVTDGVSGTGIGLTIARELARLHGGDLTLEASGVGACFVLVIALQNETEGKSL
jgi:signal transduction histidine kinase